MSHHKSMKLIRDRRGSGDRYAGYIAKGGIPYDVEMASPVFMPLLIIAKIHEEAEEIRGAMTDAVEYADLLQALMDLAFINRVSWSEIEYQRKLKQSTEGGFIEGRVLRREKSPT